MPKEQKNIEKKETYNNFSAILENYVLTELDKSRDIIHIIKLFNDIRLQWEIDIEPKELTIEEN